MADYGGKLFNFGHEGKALIAYEQVLHKDPTLFDRDALHLWKFAETHLGQGNLTLAHGYFEALIEKHPESPLANFARLRLLDIASLRLREQDKQAEWPSLLPKLAAVKLRNNGELAAQVAMRQAWWSPGASKPAGTVQLPPLNLPIRNALAGAYAQAESSRTAFLAASLLLADMLAPDVPWQRPTGQFAESYFKRFSGSAAEPYRGQLVGALQAKLHGSLQAKVADGKLLEAIGDYEALPPSLRKVKSNPKTAWALAEAYRKLAQTGKAVELYQAATKTETDGPDRFKAWFWLSVTAGEMAAVKDGDQDQRQRLAATSKEADRQAGAAWERLKDEERTQISVAYKEPFERTVNGAARLTTGPKIVLADWTKALSTKASTTSGGDAGDWARNFSPSGSAVILLTDLGRRFAELGMTKERRQAIGLLKHMKPSQFEDDGAAKAIWSGELVKLADDYRKANEYLDAGRLYSLVGAESENWEGRAEALYKGGLLLYRAGRRAEAIDSFKKASDDGNNLFYANLAKERLSQLQ
jgi:tetratricopeptide (TPR) repeat protein